MDTQKPNLFQTPRFPQIAAWVLASALAVLCVCCLPAAAFAEAVGDVVLVLDNSGSMKKNDPGFAARDAARRFILDMGSSARVGIVLFDETARLVHPLVALADLGARESLLAATGKVDYAGKLTDSPAGVERAMYELGTAGRPEARRHILFLTDGVVDTGNREKSAERERWLRVDLAAECQRKGIRILAIAFTDAADFQLIQTLAGTTGGTYHRAPRAEDIGPVFVKALEEITGSAAVPAAAAPQAPARPVSQGGEEAGPPGISVSPRLILLFGMFLLFLVLAAGAFAVWRFRARARGAGKTRRAGSGPKTPVSARLAPEGGETGIGPVELDRMVMDVGRNPECAIHIPRKTVSARHAAIFYKDGAFYIEDKGSTNGTFLEGVKIVPEKAYRLKNGDELAFDVIRFTFSLAGPPGAGQTVVSTRGKDGALLQARPLGGSEVPRTPGPVGLDETSRNRVAALEPPRDSGEEEPKVVLQAPSAPAVHLGDMPTLVPVPPEMCKNHPAWRAAEICESCGKGFCRQCMVHLSGKKLCVSCARGANRDKG
jgi:pSer/pThr/pTyr-binding forkhead associated (FHA) protein